MKKMKNIIGLTLGALLTASVYAQAPVFNPEAPITTPAVNENSGNPVFNPNMGITPTVGRSEMANTNVAPPGGGNVFEKEVTPLLREVSRKKALLEMRKLDAEIEKTDAEILKIQKEKMAPTTSSASRSANNIIDARDINNNPINLPTATPNTTPQQLPPVNTVPVTNNTSNSSIRVLMTYGFESDLYAKITSGDQGGYVVKKGDILPDGKRVVAVRSNYIEVSASKVKSPNGTQKIYVTGPAPMVNGQPIPQLNTSGNAGSTNLNPGAIPLLGPMTTPGMVSSGVNVQLPNSMPGNNNGIPPTMTNPIPPQLNVTPLR